METIDDEKQLLAVNKVLDEMHKVETYASNWNAMWWEQCLNAYSLSLYYITQADVFTLERKYNDYYKLGDVFSPELKVGAPLKTAELVDDTGYKHNVEFGRIDWYGMESNRSVRNFTFSNNGLITINKVPKHKLSFYNPKLSYNASFNVLSNNFDISVINEKLTSFVDGKSETDNYTFSLNENELTMKLNEIEIIKNIHSGKKSIRIVKPFNSCGNNLSIRAEMYLKLDGTLKLGLIAVNSHKEDGKINGSFRFEVTHDRGVHAKFVSRRGDNIDIKIKNELLDDVIGLLEQEPSVGSLVIIDFINSVKNVLKNSPNLKFVPFNSLDFEMNSLKDIENQIINIVKSIKGELPLAGLVERLDSCFEQIGKKHEMVEEEPSILRLDRPLI